MFGVDLSTGSSADAPLASANKPAAPNTGIVLPLRLRIDTRFAFDIGKTSSLPSLSRQNNLGPQFSVPRIARLPSRRLCTDCHLAEPRLSNIVWRQIDPTRYGRK
jgi:hypothetical protein